MKKVSLTKQSFFLFIGRSSSLIVQLFVPIILVRFLSKEDYGVYQQFVLLTTSLITVLQMGLGSSLYYLYPIQKDINKNTILLQTLLMLIFIGLLFSVIYISIGRTFLNFLNFTKLSNYTYEIGVFVFFMLVSSITDHIFTIRKEHLYNLFFFPIDRILKVILILSFIYYYGTFYGGIIGLLIYSSIRLTFVSYYYKDIIRDTKVLFNRYFIKTQLLYSFPIAASILLRIFYQTFDKFLINQYISPSEYAIYAVSFFSIPFLNQLFLSINNVIVPKLTEYYKKKDVKNALLLWKKSVLKTSSVTIPIVFFFMLMAKEIIILLYSPKYEESAFYFRLYIISLLFNMLNRGLILRSFNKTKVLFYINLFSTIIIVIIGFTLIKYFKLVGAMITAVMGICIPTIITLLKERSLLKEEYLNWLPWKNILNITIISLLSLIIILPIKLFISNLLLKVIISSIIFGILVILFEWKIKVFIYPSIVDKIVVFINRIKSYF